jgi:hypothetical protein
LHQFCISRSDFEGWQAGWPLLSFRVLFIVVRFRTPRVIRVFFAALAWWPVLGVAPLGLLVWAGLLREHHVLPALGLSLLVPITITILWLWRRHPVENEAQAIGDSIGNFFETIWIGIAWVISYTLVIGLGLLVLGGVAGLLLFGLRQLF